MPNAIPKAVVVPKSKKSAAPARRAGLAMQVGIVLGGGTLLAVAVGAYLVYAQIGSAPAPKPSLAEAAPAPVDRSGSIVVRNTTGPGCHRMKFNNATGAITDDGPAPCQDLSADFSNGSASSNSSAAAAERFGQISAGFQHR